jgi:hypothetical protein
MRKQTQFSLSLKPRNVMVNNKLSEISPEMSTARKMPISAANIGNYDARIYQSIVVPIIRS